MKLKPFLIYSLLGLQQLIRIWITWTSKFKVCSELETMHFENMPAS
jgi:hypothetical protein